MSDLSSNHHLGAFSPDIVQARRMTNDAFEGRGGNTARNGELAAAILRCAALEVKCKELELRAKHAESQVKKKT
jgi:hypothetical protein